MARCDWLAFGKHQCPVHFRFHENICYILSNKITHTRCIEIEMRDEAGRCRICTRHLAQLKVLLVEWAVLRAFAIRPWGASLWVSSFSYLPWFTVRLQYQNFHRPGMIFDIKYIAVELTRQNVDSKAGVRSFYQMVFRNTTHMGSGFVIRTQTTTLHQCLGLRWMIDAWENTVISSETEPKPARQVQEHKTISLNNIKKPSATYYPKNSHATKHNILHN